MIAQSWSGRFWQWTIGGLAGTLAIGVSESVSAQIVPDNTLGAESSVVTPNVNIKGVESDRIDNGAIRGANLFHSFEEFNVGAGRGAYFSNPAGIENIFSRVTGAKSSQILGRLGVLGNANLFLINPRGIVFGANSSLDVQGSFLATTADAVKLGDTGLFSAEQPASSNLLSVSPSAILFNTIAAQPIVNRSRSQGSRRLNNLFNFSPAGLQVQPGRTLALIGGNVFLEGGNLTVPGGRIELGSVAGVGQVSLIGSGNRFVLGYDSINNFGNISLSNRTFVDASGDRGGDVQIRGARLEMTQNSNIWANTLGTQNGGEVLVRTTEIVLSDDSQLRVDVAPLQRGNAGNITIDTSRLLVRDGAEVSVRTFGAGKGGSLQITASDSVEVIGTSASSPLFGSELAAGSSVMNGEAGDVKIETRRLLVRDGGSISANTFEGKGGSLQITADSVEVTGISATKLFGSGLFTTSGGSGNAGNLKIDTRRLLVSDGGVVSASTEREGKGGSLQINASDSVEVTGKPDGRFRQLGSGLFAASSGSGDAGSGDAGNLRIKTGHLVVSDGAVISSASVGDGTAGNINITVRDTLRVDNGTISNNTSRSAGGAITIQAGDIRLFGDSDIRTDVDSGADDGGTITLMADSILAFDDSDILAFARDGRGGNITIDTPAFFGENNRSVPRNTVPDTLDGNNRVDLNATAAVSGTIAIPDVSFIQNSLTELPENQIDTDNLLASSCISRRNQPTRGSFTVTGTGGLPQRPGDAQISSFPTVDMETLPGDSIASNPNPNRSWQKGDPIVEPLGVYRLANGKLVLSRECS